MSHREVTLHKSFIYNIGMWVWDWSEGRAGLQAGGEDEGDLDDADQPQQRNCKVWWLRVPPSIPYQAFTLLLSHPPPSLALPHPLPSRPWKDCDLSSLMKHLDTRFREFLLFSRDPSRGPLTWSPMHNPPPPTPGKGEGEEIHHMYASILIDCIDPFLNQSIHFSFRKC